jgi:hypothetical protein
MSESKFPTEIVTLPSRGLLYPEDNILHKGEIEMKYMGAKEEDILTNANYLKNGTIIDKLIKSLIVTPINIDDLLIGDKDAILIAARILGYGKDYETGKTYLDKNGVSKPAIVDLSTLKERILSIESTPKTNNFDFILPKSNISITFKILTSGDEKAIENDIKGLIKIYPEETFDVSTRLKHIITSVRGKENISDIWNFVDGELRADDARALRKKYDEVSPGVVLKGMPNDLDYAGEGIEFNIGLDFFWPDARI